MVFHFVICKVHVISLLLPMCCRLSYFLYQSIITTISTFPCVYGQLCLYQHKCWYSNICIVNRHNCIQIFYVSIVTSLFSYVYCKSIGFYFHICSFSHGVCRSCTNTIMCLYTHTHILFVNCVLVNHYCL